MVFHHSHDHGRRRGGPVPAAAGDPNHALKSFPNELMFTIFDGLSVSDLLNARQICRNTQPVCDALLAARLPRLYIHPTPKSLKVVLDICDHPFWSKAITEVVLLGQSTVGYQPGTLPDARFLPWQMASLDAMSSWAAKGKLIDALAKLPRLAKVSFAEKLHQPGLGGVKQSTIQAYALKCADKTTCPRPSSLSNLDMVLSLVDSERLMITELATAVDLTSSVRVDYWRKTPCLLTKIEIHLDRSQSGTVTEFYYHALLSFQAKRLKHLRVVLLPTTADQLPRLTNRHNHNGSGGLSHLLRGMCTEELSTLELAGLPKPGVGSMGIHRPAHQVYDLSTLLKHHRQTLRNLTIDNLSVANVYRSPRNGMRSVIATVQRLQPPLDVFSWQLPRYTHDPWCKTPHHSLQSQQCKLKCGRYGTVFPRETSSVDEFDLLAAELGVPFDPETECWDFGAAAKGRFLEAESA